MAGTARSEVAPVPAVSTAVLIRYRVMAFTTAVLLIVIVFVGIPLQVAAHKPEVVNVVGTMHGFLYIVYLFAAFSLTRRLRVPWWQMALVLLAGTVPFAAFVAERKMTRRFEAAAAAASEAAAAAGSATSVEGASSAGSEPSGLAPDAQSDVRSRWLSRRALVLHAEVAVLAPACAAAGWWQATRALGGNELSWVYSIEWPIFALVAIWGWWQLVHEDPAAFRARRSRRRDTDLVAAQGALASSLEESERIVDPYTTHRAARLALGVAVESLLGVMSVLSVPYDRPAGWLPSKGTVLYVTHSAFGLAIAVGAVALVLHTRASNRISKATAWMGLVGVSLSGAGGLLTAGQEVTRFFGVALMGVGAIWAGLSYLIPVVQRSSRRRAAAIVPSGG